MDPSATNYVIIGAGPVGLLTAISIRDRVISRRDKNKNNGSAESYSPITITIYERRTNISQMLHESYPIGINPRGLNALKILGHDAFEEVQRTGAVVNSFDVYSGSRNVYSGACGTVLGHTRYGVTVALYKQAKKAGIEIKFGHKLIDLDASKHVLTFQEEESNKSRITVDCSDSIVIAADGANSATRRLLMAYAAASPHLRQPYTPTRFSFTQSGMKIRVLIIDGTEIENVPLSPESHSVYNNIYCALVGPPDDRRWRIAITVEEGEKDAELIALESNDPTPEDMQRLRSFVGKRVHPLKETEKYFTDEEIRSFFSRRTFSPDLFSLAPFHYPHTRGKIAGNKEMNDVNPWIVFLGDSAHSVFPSIGEGMNSGLEDVLVFNDSVLSPAYDRYLPIDLTAYTEARQSDIDALLSLAREKFFTHAGEPKIRVTNMIVMIASSIARKLRLISPQMLYSTKVLPYREIYSTHVKETALIRSVANTLVCSFFWAKSFFSGNRNE